MSIIIPDAYGIVERNVYRAATLTPSSFHMFKHIKTMLLLSPEPPSKALQTWSDENKVNFVHVGSLQNTGWKPVSEEVIKEGLEIILNEDMHPVLVMCATGVQETGTLVGCLRKLQNWSFSSIIVEYRSFAGNRGRYVNEQFIELFDLDLITLPPNLPGWFKEHRRLLKEEEEEILTSNPNEFIANKLIPG